MTDIYHPAPFCEHPRWPQHTPAFIVALALDALVKAAAAGPCAKSKRGAIIAADGLMLTAVNAPAGGRPCDGSAACRANCSQVCNHAEERAVLQALRHRPLHRAHVIHVAVDPDGTPRDKAVPGCVSCSRLMLEAGVEFVWLWGGAPARWQVWTAADFHAATLANLGLHDPLRAVEVAQ